MVTGASGFIGRAVPDLIAAGRFLAADIPAASRITRELLGWEPSGPTLLDDIAAGHYDR